MTKAGKFKVANISISLQRVPIFRFIGEYAIFRKSSLVVQSRIFRLSMMMRFSLRATEKGSKLALRARFL
jgi:hypothetical protein